MFWVNQPKVQRLADGKLTVLSGIHPSALQNRPTRQKHKVSEYVTVGLLFHVQFKIWILKQNQLKTLIN